MIGLKNRKVKHKLFPDYYSAKKGNQPFILNHIKEHVCSLNSILQPRYIVLLKPSPLIKKKYLNCYKFGKTTTA